MNALHAVYPDLYGSNYSEKRMDERFSHLLARHTELFGKDKETMLFSTAGRTELAGNHTDHNLGLVITASINLDTIAAVSLRDDMQIILNSEGFPEDRIDISDLRCHEEERNTTASLIRGIAKAFTDRGMKIGGFSANTTTNVLKGSGLSSSAAIEVLIGEILNSIYNNDQLAPVEIAKIGQYAENVYYGKPSGLMDQIGCAEGGIVGVDFKDPKNPILTPLDINFQQYGYHLVIVDTKGNHANLTSEYAAIPKEMKEVAAYFGAKVLREVPFKEFLASLAPLKEALHNDRALLRAYHYFTENERVKAMLEALKANDFDRYLYLIEESGNSSFRFLQNVYANCQSDDQGLSVGLALAEHILAGRGASRVHGGGFAGTIAAYVPDDLLSHFTSEMDKVFGKGSACPLAIRKMKTSRIF